MIKQDKNVFILIPSLNPDENLIKYIEDLDNNGYKNIILINDGSDQKYDEIYNEILKSYKCVFIKHDKNKGKGAALKNGFKYYLDLDNKDDFLGIITVDSDGQHLVDDVNKIYDALQVSSNKLILGVRDFTSGEVPKKSSFGNNLTSKIFKLLYRREITDTQTGLRGVPNKLVEQLAKLSGDRYEYETIMLIDCIKNNIEFEEIKITTVYINNNSGTHFRPIVDSVKIYWSIFNIFLKYSIVSIVSFLVDIILFKILFNLLNLNNIINSNFIILTATIVSRICSSLVNYILNRKVSFNSKKSVSSTIFKYYILVVIQMFVSGALVSGLYALIKTGEVTIKIIVDVLIFIVNYKIQKKYIF